ncbi:hypothetical protein D3C80_1348300 [compost metagenome]
MLGKRWQPWVVNKLDLRLARDKLRHLLGVGAMAVHAQGQGLDPAHQQRSIVRRQHRPGHVFQPFKAYPINQRLAPDHQPCSDITVATQVFGRRMHHQVGAHFQRPLQIRGAVSVVDHDMQVMPTRGVGHRCDIDQLHVGVGRGFEVDHPCFAGNCRLECLDIVEVDVMDLHPELADAMVQEGERTAIQRTPDDQLIARP